MTIAAIGMQAVWRPGLTMWAPCLLAFTACLVLPTHTIAAETKPAALAQYGIEARPLTVSGLSSGGYMAVQLAVAHSAIFSGVGAIAAGPYGCAHTGGAESANAARALGPCMAGQYGWVRRWQCMWFIATCPGPDHPDAAASVRLARENARRNAIDPLEQVKRQRVFLLSGRKDTSVVPAVVDALQAFYTELAPDHIVHERLDDAAHTFPTEDFAGGNPCSRGESPYVSDCDYDAAGKVLQTVHGPLVPRNNGGPAGTLVEFDQTAFFPRDADAGMAATGYVYVPRMCSDKLRPCTLHIALHGCRQSAADVRRGFVEGAGYNRWADTNAIIVLYPQVRGARNLFARNPRNCWDWWGYSGTAWLDKRAPQMQAIIAMIDRLRSRP
jgi:pimeloyl-ACP methyl ester carboxylesterase